jgi:hypothetical protein
MEEIYSQINKNEQNNENCEKNEEKLWFLHWNKIFIGGPPPLFYKNNIEKKYSG